MDDERTSFDIEGQEVNLNIPEGAVITGAVVVATYQRLDEDGQAAAGTLWGMSPVPMVQAVGMVRLAQMAIEGEAWNTD